MLARVRSYARPMWAAFAVPLAIAWSAGIAAAQIPSIQWEFNGPMLRLGTLRDGIVVGPGIGPANVVKAISVSDAFGRPVPNSVIELNFSACSGPGADQEFRLAETQPHHPGALTNCPARIVAAITDVTGTAVFRIAGGVLRGPGSPPGYAGLPVPSSACVTVHADGVFLGRLVASAADQDLSGGVTPADLSLVLGDRLGYIQAPGPGAYRARSDFDGDGDVDPADIGVMLAFRLEASVNGATGSATPACP